MKKINYSFDNVFFDSQYSDVFIELCKKNKLIKQDILCQTVEFDGRPLIGEKKLLRSLVLFDKIDFASSIYDCSELVERELISTESICCSNLETDPACEEVAVSIMSAYKTDIIQYLKREYKNKLKMLQDNKTPSHEYWRTRVYNGKHMNRVFITSDFSADLDNDYYTLIENLDQLYSIGGGGEAFLHHYFFMDQIGTLLGLRNNIAYALMSSNEKKSIYLSDFLTGKNEFIAPNPAENVYAFVKARLPDEINILPMPQTLQDVWKMRQNPAIVSFRKVMGEWDYYINHGDISAAEKIEKDIIKANQYLEKIEKYKKCMSSPYVRTGYFLGGFIPNISNVLNVISFVEPIITDGLLKKYSWTHINDK